jgi:hypothetical protein
VISLDKKDNFGTRQNEIKQSIEAVGIGMNQNLYQYQNQNQQFITQENGIKSFYKS